MVCTDAANHFNLTVYDVINYNDVTSATNPYVFIEDVLFTDIQIVKKIQSDTLIFITY